LVGFRTKLIHCLCLQKLLIQLISLVRFRSYGLRETLLVNPHSDFMISLCLAIGYDIYYTIHSWHYDFVVCYCNVHKYKLYTLHWTCRMMKHIELVNTVKKWPLFWLFFVFLKHQV
jgi:hypothetical protein